MNEDDMPPPLEDMSEQINLHKQFKSQVNPLYDNKNDEEEVRLAPKKEQPIPNVNQKQVSSQAQQVKKETTDNQSKKNEGFGGMKGGFLLGGNKPKPKPQADKKEEVKKEVVQQQQKKVEDLTHIKSKGKEEQLKISEVQEAMQSTLVKNKDEWLNKDFFTKLASNPKLLAAFQNPKYMAALSHFGKNPQEAMQQYGGNPEFRELMMELSGFMGHHFEDLDKQKQKEAEEKMKNDPIMHIIENDPVVKEILEDPKVKNVILYMQKSGGLDLHQVMSKDPQTGRKLQVLIQKGVFNVNATAPV